MKLFSPGSTLAIAIGIAVACGIGSASYTVGDLESHSSSLRARLTMADGSVRPVTLEGVGCPRGMCSRVKAREFDKVIWLDGLSSIKNISHTAGAVAVTLVYKDGTERHAAVVVSNRVLYLRRSLGQVERLDMGSVDQIDFD
jgi:hypothetical protein